MCTVMLLAKCHYHTTLKSTLKNAYLSVILDLVANNLKQAVCNLYYKYSFTGAFVVLLCHDIAILSFTLVLSQVFVSGHIRHLFASSHSWFLVGTAVAELASFCRSHYHLLLLDNF